MDILKDLTGQNSNERFAEMLLHDLIVPTVAQIRGLELLENGVLGKTTPAQKEIISNIKESCKCILDMISKMQNLHKIEIGIEQPIYEYFSFADLLQECFEQMDEYAGEKDVTFVYSAACRDVNIEADRLEIKKVILNLLSNALIYSEKCEKIYVKTNLKINYLEVEISTKGIALTECSKGSLSGLIPQYTNVGQSLGLYLSKRIMDMHGGKIQTMTDGITSNAIILTIPVVSKAKFANSFYKHL